MTIKKNRAERNYEIVAEADVAKDKIDISINGEKPSIISNSKAGIAEFAKQLKEKINPDLVVLEFQPADMKDGAQLEEFGAALTETSWSASLDEAGGGRCRRLAKRLRRRFLTRSQATGRNADETPFRNLAAAAPSVLPKNDRRGDFRNRRE